MNDKVEQLAGLNILVVEDEYFIADDMVRSFEESGAEVTGPVGSLGDALELVARTPHLDGAVLDINLRGEMAFPIADALQRRNIPYVFATGYDRAIIPGIYDHVTRCEKPVEPARVARALFASLDQPV